MSFGCDSLAGYYSTFADSDDTYTSIVDVRSGTFLFDDPEGETQFAMAHAGAESDLFQK